MAKNKGFSLALCSDLSFEGMVVDLKFNDHPVAIANYEKGADNIEIEISPSSQEKGEWTFPLDEFINVLNEAKKILEKCAEEDKTRKNY